MTARRQHEELMLEAARWFGWAADACRSDNRREALACATVARRTLVNVPYLTERAFQGEEPAEVIAVSAQPRDLP